MPDTRFAELLGRSCFSFLEGASHPEELVSRAQELGLEALALSDRDGLYGSVRMHAAAQERDQKVIVAAELTIERTGETPRPYKLHPYPSVTLLVENHRGYAALCRLLTATHAEHEKGEAGISIEQIIDDTDGLLAIIPLDPRCPLYDAELAALHETFRDRCAIATWRHLTADDRPRLKAARHASKRFSIPIIASARPRYHHRQRKPLADVLQCVRLGTTLEQAGTALSPNAEATLKSARDMQQLFPRQPQWLARTLELAERCSFSLSELRYCFPSEYGNEEDGKSKLDPNAQLRLAVEQGIKERYPEGIPENVHTQFNKELKIIAELDVAPYFLSVKQIVDIARERSILCQGRGSAANSAVCYLLGITAVDPARGSLLFERFMSSERHEPPDIDVDFEHERREEVIQEIYRRYGRDRAAMVSEVITYRRKSALREVGKVFGLASDQLDRLSALAAHDITDPKAVSKALAQRGLDSRDEGLRRAITVAHELEGFPRHLSVHVGGFVLSAEPLHQVAPIEPARMAQRTVIPWDKDDLDALGFFKVDVLGLGMLTAIRKALAAIHAYRGHAPSSFDPIVALANIPPEDSNVYDAICQADTIGVFQIESRAQMAMLPVLKPRKFYDLVVEVGIVRPGPIQGKMVHPYLRRRTGEEPISFPHPSLTPILERTLGVPLFQEQVMQIAIVGAGYSPGEADQLRRDMAAWRKSGRLARHRDKLLAGFRKRGITASFGEQLFLQIMGFGEYGFPESHAASFALLVYASAWLKTHHPAAFAAALINSQPMGFYRPGSLVRDAQAHDVEVRPVSVAHSDWNCTLEAKRDSNKHHQALRLGLRLISGLGQTVADRIIAARALHPFRNLDDFIKRSTLRRNEIEVLAESGALEDLEASRREALWRVRGPREGGLLTDLPLESEQPLGLPPLLPTEQLSLDYSTVGFSLDDHPMRHVRKRLTRRRVLKANSQASWTQGQQLTVAGLVLCRQRPMTASGIVFVTLEDETGTINLVLPKRIFEKHELVARHAGIILARGRVDRRGEVVHLRARYLERLDMPPAQSLTIQSRDFC